MPDRQHVKEYDEESFQNLDWSAQEVIGKTFDQCLFVKCQFTEAHFRSCKFYDCEFKSCDLSLMHVGDCEFSNVLIEDSKAVGVNWAEMRLPSVRIYCPMEFMRCNIDYSIFMGLDLSEIQIVDCQARHVDFSGANLSKSTLTLTDFANSTFNRTNLCQADFTHAVNYYIDVYNNPLKGAKFTFPEAISLLSALDIDIIDD